MEKRTRVVVLATTVFLGIVGTIYGGWAILNWILSADPLTKFLIGIGSGGSGITAAVAAAKRE